jgi:hypothetical protein
VHRGSERAKVLLQEGLGLGLEGFPDAGTV